MIMIYFVTAHVITAHTNIHGAPRLLLIMRLHHVVAVCVVCCSVLQCVAVHNNVHGAPQLLFIMRLHHVVAVCCSVLQCVAVCYSVLQCVAVCCSVLQCIITYTKRHCYCSDVGMRHMRRR